MKTMCGSRKYPYHPPWKGFAVGPPLPFGFSNINPQNVPPSSPPEFPKVCTPPGIIAISVIEVNK